VRGYNSGIRVHIASFVQENYISLRNQKQARN
jgi:hypothetical protein